MELAQKTCVQPQTRSNHGWYFNETEGATDGKFPLNHGWYQVQLYTTRRATAVLAESTMNREYQVQLWLD